MSRLGQRVLTIAGSDSGGGAGIQADIKTITALGGYAMTAITALTAQNTKGVFGVHHLPVEFIARQMEVVIEDIGVDCIKIGMLGRAPVVDIVCDTLEKLCPDVSLVVDPVMVAKGGQPLLDPEAVARLRTRLVPRATILTPNIPEAEALAGFSIIHESDVSRALDTLSDMGARAILLKGGHKSGSLIVDYLRLPDGKVVSFSRTRIDTPHTHGTGCTLAAALACLLIRKGGNIQQACHEACDFLERAIKAAPGYGGGQGPLNHYHGIGVLNDV